jgi:hypothetical protein
LVAVCLVALCACFRCNIEGLKVQTFAISLIADAQSIHTSQLPAACFFLALWRAFSLVWCNRLALGLRPLCVVCVGFYYCWLIYAGCRCCRLSVLPVGVVSCCCVGVRWCALVCVGVLAAAALVSCCCPGRPWSSLVVPGRLWSSLVVSGRPWSSLVVPGRPWSSLVVPGRPWSSLVAA